MPAADLLEAAANMTDPNLALFEEQRPRLFGIAYLGAGLAHDVATGRLTQHA